MNEKGKIDPNVWMMFSKTRRSGVTESMYRYKNIQNM